ncbi:MAG: hypothetical protein JW981_07795, partial [Anaerolineae bacterium]|nr:hypothetical protein [Anaerolineae bacterium]
MKSNLKSLLIIWLAWAVIITGFQAIVTARFQPQRPDHVLQWTAGETQADSQNDKPYLIEPFLNTHVSWDSEYYLSIATAGYDDPLVRAIPPDFSWSKMPNGPQAPAEIEGEVPSDLLSLNYAFLPFYPFVMRVIAFPSRLLGLNSIATATLAGVLVSLLGTLGAMIALYDLASSYLDEEGGIRAAFYLLIFPSSMFLAQVYTEGLFVGLAFGALALLKHRKWLWAVLLAMCATWTRAAGGLLVIPFAWAWLEDGGWDAVSLNPTLSELGRA